jgi:hypothetical protein
MIASPEKFIKILKISDGIVAFFLTQEKIGVNMSQLQNSLRAQNLVIFLFDSRGFQ